MDRRTFIQYSAAAAAGFALSDSSTLLADPLTEQGWRTFEVTTSVEVLKHSGSTRVWVPSALLAETPFQKTLSNRFVAERGAVHFLKSKTDGLGILLAEFPSGVRPVLSVISRVATKNYSVDFSAPHPVRELNRAQMLHFLRPTKLLPTDGIVKTTAYAITSGKRSDLEKARAIYEWIVENTFRNPKTRGCGVGDIRFMLETKDLSGKCADLNALYVGLARAAGLPARDVYGIRVAKSELGYKSLGVSSEYITKAQHCRAEVYLSGFGWTPVDPADVRKVVLEEPPGNLPLSSSLVESARNRLFGSWEMNWMAYNFAHDISLPGSSGKPLGFFMYPQAESSAGRLDCLDPDNFHYQIQAREVASPAV